MEDAIQESLIYAASNSGSAADLRAKEEADLREAIDLSVSLHASANLPQKNQGFEREVVRE